MSGLTFRYGLHVAGPTHSKRAVVEWVPLLVAAANVTPPFDPACEQYASAFHFDRAMPGHLKANDGSSAGFAGPVWSMVLHFDLDAADDIAPALDAGRRLATTLLQRYPALGEGDLEVFYSGGRSVHVGLPLPHRPEPGPAFHLVCRKLATRLAKLAGVDAVGGVKFDEGNYDKVRLWRLVNSRHARTGLYKVRLCYDELMRLSAEGVRRLAAQPRPHSPEDPTLTPEPRLAHDWCQTAEAVGREQAEKAQHRAADVAAGGPDRLNRATLDYIREGAGVGDRHRLLFSAAANLGEFDCPPRLAMALLMETALDSGLAPADAARQVECGLKRAAESGGGCAGG
ncbi:MAG TPA: hypothetical protein VM533_05510 [Fimbriiglobus sp.]|nr:hypothetical protein [Fimbriiglobus sp.]